MLALSGNLKKKTLAGKELRILGNVVFPHEVSQ